MKMVCVLGCVIALILVGCQTQLNLSNTKTNSGQIIEDSVPNLGSTSGSNSVNTDAESKQTDSKDNSGTETSSEGDPANAPIQSAPISGDSSWNEDDSDSVVILDEKVGEHKLKTEGSLHGEIEVAHKLPCGKMALSEGDTAFFHFEITSDDAELKITLIGTETGMALVDSVIGSGNISFEINIADEYTVVLENCSLCGVKFTVDYSIGGSI